MNKHEMMQQILGTPHVCVCVVMPGHRLTVPDMWMLMLIALLVVVHAN